MIRTYSELIRISTFEERFRYLKLDGIVGADTFGFDRVFNQRFYTSREWKLIRDRIIVRDMGCDIACRDHTIFGRIYIHHMNPISLDDIQDATPYLTNPEYLICVSYDTHNAIHFGNEDLLPKAPVERTPYDTCPWKS